MRATRRETLVSWSAPDQERWDRRDRVVVCYVTVDGGRVAGSLQGAGDQIDVIPFAAGEDDPAIDPYAADDPET